MKFTLEKAITLKTPYCVLMCQRAVREMEMVVAMQSVRVVMQRGSQKVIRNWHLMKKGK